MDIYQEHPIYLWSLDQFSKFYIINYSESLLITQFNLKSLFVTDAQMEQGYRSEVQERALVVSLQMFSLILERGVSLLKSQLEGDELPKLVVGEDMQVLLPAIKVCIFNI